MDRSHSLLLSFAAILFLLAPSWAAEPDVCALTPLPPGGSNMFNAEQEIALGDLLAARIENELSTMDDPALTAYLEGIGGRLVRHLPPTKLRFRFYLSNEPEANAFAITGGRVYVTRKLIMNARTEDEVAGVIGHELGHIVTHQLAQEYTGYFKQLGIFTIGDSKDLQEKFHRFLEHNNQVRFGGKGEDSQQVADHIGMEAVVRAGYRAEAYADFFDRIFENKGQKGSWWSDITGNTPPNARRYREMVKLLPKPPSGCVEPRPADAEEAFHRWQKKVGGYHGTGRVAALHGVTLKRVLEPPLQDDLRVLHFSRDGKFLLAQGAGSVAVARTSPPEVLFEIEATDAYPAQFTPDSKQVLVYDRALRIERWDIANQERVNIYDVSAYHGCRQALLSPDGNTLACLDRQATLALINTSNGDRILERKAFDRVDVNRMLLERLAALHLGISGSVSPMAYSPDGRYFLAVSPEGKALAYDLVAHSEVHLGKGIGELGRRDFTFVTPDTIAGVMGSLGERSRVVKFPGGELVKEINTGAASLQPVSHGGYVLLRPVEGFAVGALDVEKNKVVRANKNHAFDVFDDTFVSEMGNGDVGLFKSDAKPVAVLKLPRGRLGPLQAFAVAPDFRWLAISGRERGAVWNLGSGERVYNVKAFHGAYVAGNDVYLDFPKQGETPRSIVQLGLEKRGMSMVHALEETFSAQHGALLAVVRPADEVKPTKDGKPAAPSFKFDLGRAGVRNVTLKVAETRSGKELWSRRFEDILPPNFLDDAARTMVFRWMYDAEIAKRLVPDQAERTRLRGGSEDYLLEVVDAFTGAPRGHVVVKTSNGAFNVEMARAAGDVVAVTDDLHRIVIYSLKSGEILGRIFGELKSLSPDGRFLCVEHERGRIAVYDTATAKALDEFAFVNGVEAARFNGNQLFVLTADQTAYILQVRNE